MRRKQWLELAVGVAVVACAGSLGAAAEGELLIEAVKSGDRAAVQAILQTADVNDPSVDGTTALHWAVHRDDAELVNVLIRAGANVKATNRYGVAPLSLAAQNGNAWIIERLIAAGADANAALPGGESVLMTAARTGNSDAIKALLDHGADVNAKTPRGQTALMWAAAKNNADTVKLLVERGADINARTANDTRSEWKPRYAPFDAPPPTGFTALLFAVRTSSIDAVRALLDAGADVNETLSDGQSALVVALANRHWEVADFLLDRGADPNLAGAGWNALHQAVRMRRPNPMGGRPAPISMGSVDSIDVIKKMIVRGVKLNARMTRNGMKDGQRNRLIRTGATAFLLAAKSADVETMKVLLAAGADPRIPTMEDVSPLMVAAGVFIWHPGEDGGSLAGDADQVLEAVKICVELGNDVNAVDAYGYTALHGAAFRGVNSIVKYLVEKGAKLDARTHWYDPELEMFRLPSESGGKFGWTPLALARGLTFAEFYVDQLETAELLRRLMEARGLPTENEVVDPEVCLDCVSNKRVRAVFFERERDGERKIVAAVPAPLGPQ